MGRITRITALAAVPAMVLAMTALPCRAAQPLSEDTVSFYEEWKERYLVQDPYVTDEAQYYVWYSEKNYASAGYSVEVTVSEAHGYGMLITACMADYDSEAKALFDGMYRFYRAHLSEIGPNLMAWQQEDTGTAIVNASGADSASDGDMDIAYALLMADTIWGSDGDIDYKQAAVDMISDIMEYEVSKTDWIIQLGDWVWWSDEGDPYYAATRSSDFLVQYMPVFARATGDDRWMNVYESTYAIINRFVETYGTGLLPDFIVKDSTGAFVPAQPDFLESENDGSYYYNSCRTPWRISMDYLISGNEDALAFARTLNAFITADTGGDPWEICAGFTPEGNRIEDYNDLCFTAPFLVAAACGGDSQWHAALRDTVVQYGEDVYYGDTIKLLCLIADDGGWIVPSGGDPLLMGDVNLDGSVSVTDLVLLCRHLLSVESLTQEQCQQADVSQDGSVNCFDLGILKKMLFPRN